MNERSDVRAVVASLTLLTYVSGLFVPYAAMAQPASGAATPPPRIEPTVFLPVRAGSVATESRTVRPARAEPRLSDAPRRSEPQVSADGPRLAAPPRDPRSVPVESAPSPDEVEEPRAPARPKALPTGGPANAVNAVTSSRLAMPSGEGSIEGLGESFSPDLSAGSASSSVPIAVPPGRGDATPELSLSYSSGGGNGPLGIGWNLSAASITRQTSEGTPRYRDQPGYTPEEDRLVFNGGEDLVPVDNAAIAAIDASGRGYVTSVPSELRSYQQYRAETEGGFSRIFRSPDWKHWVVQSKDGSRLDFGVIPSGKPIDLDDGGSLQSEGPNGTGRIFGWLVTRISDAQGNVVYFEYDEDQGARYMRDIFYVSPATCARDGDADQQRSCTESLELYAAHLRFAYESRADAFGSYSTGYRVEYARRLKSIAAFASEGALRERYLVRRYHLGYDPASFHSLLTTLTLEARSETDVTYGGATARIAVPVRESAVTSEIVGVTLPPMRFSYARLPTTGMQAAGFGGLDARVRAVAFSPPVSLSAADVDLWDVNSDGLQDVVVTDPAMYRTPQGGVAAGVFFNGFKGEAATPAGSTASFSQAISVPVPVGMETTFRFTTASLVPMDVDADGRGDFLHMPRLGYYGFFTIGRTSSTPSTSPAQQGFRIGYQPVSLPSGADPRIDLVLDGSHYRAMDVNADRLVDIVRTSGLAIDTWLNLANLPNGEGRFGHADYDPNTRTFITSTDPLSSCLPNDSVPVDFADGSIRTGDMNGDGHEDIVRLSSGRLVYWPGRGGESFGDGPATCSGAGTNRHRTMTGVPTVLLADLEGVHLVDVDGDGASDLVQVRYAAVDVWFNRAGIGFTERITIASPYSPSVRDDFTFADINGSGTIDLVYGRADNWTFIDLAGGTRPRVLTRIENGLGATTEFEYGSSAEDYTSDLATYGTCNTANCPQFTWDFVDPSVCDRQVTPSGECLYRTGNSPVISTVLRRVTTWDGLSGVGMTAPPTVREFRYHDGYYEGIDQEFRGFRVSEERDVGDETQPTSWRRSYFHQGRRPSEIASDRTAQNPNEALKGREYMVEQFEEDAPNRTLHTSFSAFTLRTLGTGLDGRAITYAYSSEQNAFDYDTTTYAPSSTTVGLASIIRERVLANGSVDESSRTVTSTNVSLRGARYRWTKNSVDEVDNLGHVLQQTSYGRLHDEDDGPANDVVPYAEAITEYSRAKVITASTSGFLFRVGESWLGGHGDGGQRISPRTYDFDARGNEIRSTEVVSLPVSGAYPFEGDGNASSFTQTEQTHVTTTAYDAFGNEIAYCGGGEVSTPAACLRYGKVEWDGTYAAVVTQESIAVAAARTSGCSVNTPLCMLTTQATWDRGLGVVVSGTDANGKTSRVEFDGFGRLAVVHAPTMSACPSPNPISLYRYDIGIEGKALHRIVATTFVESGDSCAISEKMRSVVFVDGMGRSRTSLTYRYGWDRSGVSTFNARGAVACTYDPMRIADGTVDDIPSAAIALAPPSNAPRVGCSFYDAFGRNTSATEYTRATNRTVVIARMEHHVSSVDAWDALDIAPPPNRQHFLGTYKTVRTDGHGRTIDTVERLRAPGASAVDFLRLFVRYRADGSLVSITRTHTVDAKRERDTDLVDPDDVVTRSFVYDTAGRRIASSHPDVDDPTASDPKHGVTRYLYNPIGDLVAFRDVRGCGLNYVYDRAGRLIGETDVSCAEAQSSGDVITSGDLVPTGSVGIGLLLAPARVHTFYSYDVLPTWLASTSVTPPAANALGRSTGMSDVAQRSALTYDELGHVVWVARQMALIAGEGAIDQTLEADRPAVDTNDAPTALARTYDPHTYVERTAYNRHGEEITREYPTDPDFGVGGGASPPAVVGRITYGADGRPRSSSASIGDTTYPILTLAQYDAQGALSSETYGVTGVNGTGSARTYEYDARHRPTRIRTHRFRATPGSMDATDRLPATTVFMDYRFVWDEADNLVEMFDGAGPLEGRPTENGFRSRHLQIEQDSMYRVASIDYAYLQDDGTYAPSDVGTDFRTATTRTNVDGRSHADADPMRERPAPSVAAIAPTRVNTIDYHYDWLANETRREDDAFVFHERGLGRITSGASEAGLRPSALYFASNIDDAQHTYDPVADRGGFLEVSYGKSGNVQTVTVHAQCRDASPAALCIDAVGQSSEGRALTLNDGCSCLGEQHFQYRWDERNHISEARRYDRSISGPWLLAARLRYRYDGANGRLIKQSIAIAPAPGEPNERISLDVFPGDYERAGVTVDRASGRYAANTSLETESVYGVVGARIVWKDGTPLPGFDPRHRISFAFEDILGSTGATVDLRTGELLELGTYYPNGATETWRRTTKASHAGERFGFTGKESDSEVGIQFFGERYLLPALGRWASPDPITINGVGADEEINAYHYVSGNLLQARDPDGLFLHILAGAGIGAVLGGGIEAARQMYRHGRVTNWRRVGAAAAGGAIGGAIGAATGGASLIGAGVGTVARTLGGAALSGVADGQVQRMINGERTTARAVVFDAVTGVVGEGAGRVLGAVARRVGGAVRSRVASATRSSASRARPAPRAHAAPDAPSTHAPPPDAPPAGAAEAPAPATCTREGCGGPNMCFVEGTPVVTSVGALPIEAIRLGARVRTLDESACSRTLDATDTWHTVTAEIVRPDAPHDPIRFRLIRSASALALAGAFVGAIVPSAFTELDLSGDARVLAIAPAPEIEDGPGCIVTGRFEHVNNDVVRVGLADGSVLEATSTHPLYVVERSGFVQVATLAPGEHLRTAHGDVAVAVLESLEDAYRVVNLEIEGAHTYLAGETGVWAHNNGCNEEAVSALDRLRADPDGAPRQELYRAGNAAGSTRGGAVHHIVPVAEAGHSMLDLAARGGFNVSGMENGVLLTQIHRGNHPRYSRAVRSWMDRWMSQNANATAEQAATALRGYTDRLRRGLSRVDEARAVARDRRALQ